MPLKVRLCARYTDQGTCCSPVSHSPRETAAKGKTVYTVYNDPDTGERGVGTGSMVNNSPRETVVKGETVCKVH